MRKRISIDELKVGMKIEKLDRSWLSTPFLRNRFTVTSRQQIDQLRASGVLQLDIDADSGDAAPDAGDLTPAGSSGETLPPVESAPEVLDAPAATSFAEEMHAAKQAYHAAKGVIQQAMEDVRMGGALNMEAVQQVVAGMADSILRNQDALTSLSRLKQFDEYTFYHSVNTSLLALSLGRDLGYARPQLLQLGTGMLLHDIGKMKIPLDILNKPGRFEAHEMEIMKQHVMRGAEVLAETTGLSDVFLKPTMEHHERVDGTGYPYQRSKEELSEFGLIASVVDIYDAVTSDRCYHKGKSPHETLQLLYQLGRRGHVDSTVVQRFVKIVGVYPVGSCVELNTGETALVTEFNHQFPMRPRVLIVTDSSGARLTRPVDVDMAAQSMKPERRIEGVCDPAVRGVDPRLYLDASAA